MPRNTLAYAAAVLEQDHPLATPAPPASGVRPRGGYSRARATVERRTAVARTAPARDHETLSGAVFDPAAVAAFDHAPEHVPARTRAVVVCPVATGGEAHGDACEACAGTGRMVTWVEIEVVREQRARAMGTGTARERHVGLLDAENFERPAAWPNQLLHQAWFRGVPPHLAPELRPELAANERVLWLLVQTFVG